MEDGQGEWKELWSIWGKKYHSLLVRSNEMETTSGTPLSAVCLGRQSPQVRSAILEDCVLQNNWTWEINWASVASCSLIPGKEGGEDGDVSFFLPFFSSSLKAAMNTRRKRHAR